VYSTQFVAGTGLTATTVSVGPVPAGEVWILRDVDAYANTGLTSRVDVNVRGSVGQTIAYLEFPPSTQASKQWTGRQVINPGESFGYQIGGLDAVDLTISGYRLTTP
jgi:hypothetical protein